MKTGSLVLAATLLALTLPATGQEGHPLKGTWIGDWGTGADDRTQVTIVMDWDGDNITGVVDPGPGSLDFRTASLDVSDWSVHIEVQGTDQNGALVEYMIDGTLTDIGLRDRKLTGTWVHGTVRNDFSITRQ